jgi:transcriptional regulator with XRE-family HTH domain
MNHNDYVSERESRDTEFREAREELKPEYEFRRAMISARLAADMTQKGLADKMGTTQSAIARLESGSQMPTLDTLFRLAAALGVDFTITPDEPIKVNPHKAA